MLNRGSAYVGFAEAVLCHLIRRKACDLLDPCSTGGVTIGKERSVCFGVDGVAGSLSER